jgi:hypothetical protein
MHILITTLAVVAGVAVVIALIIGVNKFRNYERRQYWATGKYIGPRTRTYGPGLRGWGARSAGLGTAGFVGLPDHGDAGDDSDGGSGDGCGGGDTGGCGGGCGGG